MVRSLWISGGTALIALIAMAKAPPGRADPFGTLLRTALVTGLLVFLGRLVGTARHRRPPNPQALRVLITIFLGVAIEVAAIALSPNWSIALAVWYITLFATGVVLNRLCQAPERYAVLTGTFSVVMSTIILITLSLASPTAPQDLGPDGAVIAVWRNVARVAANPGDAAWVWLAWRVADRLRAPESRRPKNFFRIPPRTPGARRPGPARR